MGDLKVNSVDSSCPSFYKEKIKETHKNSKFMEVCKKFIASLKGPK